MKFPYVAKFGDGTHITGRSIRELREAVAARFPGRSVQHDKRAGALIVRERRGRRWVEVGRATVTQRASVAHVLWLLPWGERTARPDMRAAVIGRSIVLTQHSSQVESDRWTVAGGATHTGMAAAMAAAGRPIIAETEPGASWEVAPPPPEHAAQPRDVVWWRQSQQYGHMRSVLDDPATWAWGGAHKTRKGGVRR